jgi:hypothetical protein
VDWATEMEEHVRMPGDHAGIRSFSEATENGPWTRDVLDIYSKRMWSKGLIAMAPHTTTLLRYVAW